MAQPTGKPPVRLDWTRVSFSVPVYLRRKLWLRQTAMNTNPPAMRKEIKMPMSYISIVGC